MPSLDQLNLNALATHLDQAGNHLIGADCDPEKAGAHLKAAALAVCGATEGAPELPLDELHPDHPDPLPEPQRPPVAYGEALAVQAGHSGELDLTTNDVIGSAPIASVQMVTPPARVTATLNERGVLAYSAPAGLTAGGDQLSYSVTDSNGLTSNAAVVAITVTAPEPIPPKPPGNLKLELTGFHPAKGTNQGAPVDVLRSLKACDDELRPGNPSEIVGVWTLADRWASLRPGKGMPANIFQQMTDQGQVALITIPVLVRNPADNGGKGGQGDFDSIVRGSNNLFYDTIMEWMERQGQGRARIRLGHEAELRSTFPWGIGRCPRAAQRDFSPFKEGLTHAFKYFRKHLPNSVLVWCHFWHGYLRAAGGGETDIHADEYDLNPSLYDIEALDWYDGKGQVIGPNNWEQIYNSTKHIEGHDDPTPQGLNAWEKRIKARGKTFAVDEWGILCQAPGTPGFNPARDNPFFIELMHKHCKERNWAHSCYFNPHDLHGAHKLKGGTLAGTRKATDKYIALHRK